MSLTTVSEHAIQKETAIQNKINEFIDTNQNMIFDAGAGAGKTFALVESLKHIIKNYGEILKTHNQNVMCITYTNVAMNELKHRLKNSAMIKISTIHERLWDIIKNYQEQLIQVHVENINRVLKKLNNDIYTNTDENICKKYKLFRELNNNQRQDFINKIKDEGFKENFYKAYSKNSQEFKGSFSTLPDEFKLMLKNVGNFKTLVSDIYKINKLEECLKNISNNKPTYDTIRYDSKYNSNVLHSMLISHDTLLDYTFQIIKQCDMLKHIIIHQYPYILIDEYQDTSKDVINIMTLLSDYALKYNCKFFIGYFGDTAQNIYDSGVGQYLNLNECGIQLVNKSYNRRSTQEILDVINNIRNDAISQESIYEDNLGGSVKFYSGTERDIDNFICHYKNKWNIHKNNKLHCLVLTNKLLAQYNEFTTLYSKIAETDFYTKFYKALNTELLSNDLSKLGEIPNLLYKIVNLKFKLENHTTLLTDIIPYHIYKNLTFENVHQVMNQLLSIDRNTLKKFITGILNKHLEPENYVLKEIIKELLPIQDFDYTFDNFINYLRNKLFPNAPDSTIHTDQIYSLLDIDFSEYKAWYNFLNNILDNEVLYHTYHGTKGEEYDHVIILMENDFGKEKNKFLNFFLNYKQISTLDEDENVKYINTRNLLYVACSRARKNLRILYLDDISRIKDNIQQIFGNITDCRNYS